MSKPCRDCGGEHELWWDCPKFDGTPKSFREHSNYGWHFGQFSNDARREAFYEKAAADPFGTVSE